MDTYILYTAKGFLCILLAILSALGVIWLQNLTWKIWKQRLAWRILRDAMREFRERHPERFESLGEE